MDRPIVEVSEGNDRVRFIRNADGVYRLPAGKRGTKENPHPVSADGGGGLVLKIGDALNPSHGRPGDSRYNALKIDFIPLGGDDVQLSSSGGWNGANPGMVPLHWDRWSPGVPKKMLGEVHISSSSITIEYWFMRAVEAQPVPVPPPIPDPPKPVQPIPTERYIKIASNDLVAKCDLQWGGILTDLRETDSDFDIVDSFDNGRQVQVSIFDDTWAEKQGWPANDRAPHCINPTQGGQGPYPTSIGSDVLAADIASNRCSVAVQMRDFRSRYHNNEIGMADQEPGIMDIWPLTKWYASVDYILNGPYLLMVCAVRHDYPEARHLLGADLNIGFNPALNKELELSLAGHVLTTESGSHIVREWAKWDYQKRFVEHVKHNFVPETPHLGGVQAGGIVAGPVWVQPGESLRGKLVIAVNADLEEGKRRLGILPAKPRLSPEPGIPEPDTPELDEPEPDATKDATALIKSAIEQLKKALNELL